jgi:quercetin dioxygenase-like cupin family protein
LSADTEGLLIKKFLLFALTILVATCSATAPSISELRMTPTEITSGDKGESQIGSSKLAGVHTKILAGNPAATGFYSILLFVPQHTTIQAHSHRDDRMATVVSGTWHFGYGTHFDEKALKTLPVGSVYSEPGGVNHFARTDEMPVVVHISGFGPTDTRYFDSANDPEKQKKAH